MFQAYNDLALVRDFIGPSLRTFGLDWPPQQRIYGGQGVTIGRNLKNTFGRETKFCSRHRCNIEIKYFEDMCMCLQEVYCSYSLKIFIYGAKFACFLYKTAKWIHHIASYFIIERKTFLPQQEIIWQSLKTRYIRLILWLHIYRIFLSHFTKCILIRITG